MSEQRVKILVADLCVRIRTKIAEREAALQQDAGRYQSMMDAWFDAAIDATQKTLDQLQRHQEPDDMGYKDSIIIRVDEPLPGTPEDPEKDRELLKMRGHLGLLEMAVDKTILISPAGEYGRYLV